MRGLRPPLCPPLRHPSHTSHNANRREPSLRSPRTEHARADCIRRREALGPRRPCRRKLGMAERPFLTHTQVYSWRARARVYIACGEPQHSARAVVSGESQSAPSFTVVSHVIRAPCLQPLPLDPQPTQAPPRRATALPPGGAMSCRSVPGGGGGRRSLRRRPRTRQSYAHVAAGCWLAMERRRWLLTGHGPGVLALHR